MGWIKCSERLPLNTDTVIIFEYGDVFTGYYYPKMGGWHDNDGDRTDGVTHWMPLPAPPSADETGGSDE